MRSKLPAICLLALLPLAGCDRSIDSADADPRPISQSAPAGPDSDPLARGEYMVRMGGCNDCHTPGYLENAGNVPKAQWLTGGGMGFSGPWGTTYPANLRLKATAMDEASWLQYTATLHTRPMMPDFTVRAMHEDDRRAIFRFIRSLGAAGQPAPAYLPPGKTPPPPYLQLVLPPSPPSRAPAAG